MQTMVEPALPPLHERLNNARKAAQRVITRTIRGGPLGVTSSETEQRLTICHSCEFYRDSDSTCSKCGCFIKLKARLATEACPIERWSAEKPMPQVPGAPVILNGTTLLEAELELRELLPPDAPLVQLLNKFQRDEQSGCQSCRRRRYLREAQASFVTLLNDATLEQKQSLREVFPNTTHVSTGSKALHWSVFGILS